MASEGLVVDASVFLKWYLRDEDLLVEADHLFVDWVNNNVVMIEPAHLPFEFGHAILRATRRNRISTDDADDAIVKFTSLSRRFAYVASPGIVGDAVQLARTLGVNFYDASYLQVAREQGITLLTADEAFYRQVGSRPDVRWLGDYT